jgi:hypothetical protein
LIISPSVTEAGIGKSSILLIPVNISYGLPSISPTNAIQFSEPFLNLISLASTDSGRFKHSLIVGFFDKTAPLLHPER